MKTCRNCLTHVEDWQHSCPKCGGTNFDLSPKLPEPKRKSNALKTVFSKLDNLSPDAEKIFIIATIIIAFLLGFGTHMFFGVKRSSYNSLMEQNASNIQIIEQKNATIAENNKQITEKDKKIEEYESIIQPYKDLSEAQLAEQTAAANLKAKQDQEALAAKEAAEKAAAEKAAAEKAAAEKAAAEAAAAEAAKGYETGITFDQLARTPDDYTGKKVKFKGKVIQVVEGTTSTQIRLAVNGDYDKIIYATVPKAKTTNMRILEDDTITIFGVSAGLMTYQSTLGASITIPAVTVDDWGPN